VKGLAWEVAAGVFAVALIYMLVRPSSDGPALVTAVTGAVGDIVTFAVGG
jgi:hypothetical protein